MTQEHWQQAWKLIRDFEDLPETELEPLLAAPEIPAEVRDHVRAVLSGEPEPAIPEEMPNAEDSFGPYRPLRLLGEGAMGSVYLAQQDKPLQRTVALKIIRPGLRHGVQWLCRHV